MDNRGHPIPARLAIRRVFPNTRTIHSLLTSGQSLKLNQNPQIPTEQHQDVPLRQQIAICFLHYKFRITLTFSTDCHALNLIPQVNYLRIFPMS